MAASNTDLITDTRNAARPNSARVSSGRSSGGTTLACDNLTGWPTASKVHFVTYQIDSNSNPVAGTQLDCYGIRSGNNIGSFVVVDGTDAGNSVNDVVEMLPTAQWGQDLADALTTAHDRLGVHKSGATYAAPNFSGTATGTYTLGGTPTIASPTITGTVTGAVVGTSNIITGAVTSPQLAPTHADVTYGPSSLGGISYADIASATKTFTVPANGTVGLIWFNAGFEWTGAPSVATEVKLLDGSTTVVLTRVDVGVSGAPVTHSWCGSYTFTAGSHTLKLQSGVNAGSLNSYFGSIQVLLLNT